MPSLHIGLTRRVLAGEKKNDIFRDYAGTRLDRRAAKALALIATPGNRRKNSALNVILLALLAIGLILCPAVHFMLMFHRDGVMAGFITMAALEMCAFCFIANFRFPGYALIVLTKTFLLVNEFDVFAGLTKSAVAHGRNLEIFFGALLYVLIPLILAILLFRGLFPSVGNFHSFPARDAAGNPVFKD